MSDWSCALTLDAQRQVTAGSTQALATAIGQGADLRVATEFRHNEHIDVTSNRAELVHEVAEFAVTYLLDGRWTAGIMSLRQPVELPTGFGPRPSMSYFLYNEDGGQAIARLHMDGVASTAAPGPSPVETPEGMTKYHAGSGADVGTNAPSHNFVYDFEVFHYWVDDRWTQVLTHDEQGNTRSGSIEALADAFRQGRRIKVAVSGLCNDLVEEGAATDHELFVEIGSSYYYTTQQLFIGGSHPVVRVRPQIPMAYHSRGWDSGWLVLRTDGTVVYRCCDPYTLAFDDRTYRCGLRWFVS
ncbi:MAG: hypothetical protein HOH74_25090 [Gemmatimonadetes bacterium]|nr:hypothetical protein [Gemmatimonadota bacterium]